MPRVADPGNAAGAEATRRWRKSMEDRRRPEVDAVDTALAAAVAVFRRQAEANLRREAEANLRRQAETKKAERYVALANFIEKMATNYLVSHGYDAVEAGRKVRLRTRRLDVDALVPLVNGTAECGNPGGHSGAVLTPSRKPS